MLERVEAMTGGVAFLGLGEGGGPARGRRAWGLLRRAEVAMPRVALVAENASMRFGGESLLPLQYFRGLRRGGCDAWLVVHERTRRELRSLLDEAELRRVRFVADRMIQRAVFAVSPWFGGRLPRSVFEVVSQLATQAQQRREVRGLVEREGVELVHQITPVSPKYPSLIDGVGVPVVIGPMNGGMEYPPGFRGMERYGSAAAMAWARRGATVANRVLPGKRRAAVLLVANGRTRAALPGGCRGRVVEMTENGVDPWLWRGEQRAERSHGPVRFVVMARLVEWKAVDLLVEAMAGVVREVEAELHVVGDGPKRGAIESLVRERGLGSRVVFHGFLPQARCADLLREMDAMVLSSLYECGGAVVLEGMASGLAVIATAWGGPADYLDERCGVLVEPSDRPRFIERLRRAMVELAKSPERRRAMGEAGRAKVMQRYTWDRKIEALMEVYAEVIRGRGAAVREAAMS